MHGLTACLGALVALVGAARVAGAAPLTSDSFVCNQAKLANQGGGIGWSGVWVTGQPNVFLLSASSLPGGVGEIGGSLLYDGSKTTFGTGARIFRALDVGPGSAAALGGFVEDAATALGGTQAALGKPGTTVWLGYVFNGGTAGNMNPDGHFLAQMHLYMGADTSTTALANGDNNKLGEAMAIGRGAQNTVWNFERTCAHDKCPSGSASSSNYLSTVQMDGGTHWVVLRFVFTSAATTNVTMWLDSAAGAAPDAAKLLPLNGLSSVNIDGLHFNWIELGGQTASFAFDEVRVAASYAELSSGASGVTCNATTPDAGPPQPDAAPGAPDATPGADARPITPGDPAQGCTCRVAVAPWRRGASWPLLALGLLLAVRRIVRPAGSGE